MWEKMSPFLLYISAAAVAVDNSAMIKVSLMKKYAMAANG